MISPLDEAFAHHARFGRPFLELEPRLLVAHRDGDRVEIPTIVALVARLGIPREMVDGVLLSLRPEAFPADVGADARQDLHLHVRQDEQTSDDEDEENDDEAELLADGEEAERGPHGRDTDRPLHARNVHQRAGASHPQCGEGRSRRRNSLEAVAPVPYCHADPMPFGAQA